MLKQKRLADIRRLFEREALSVWIIVLSLMINVLAWVVPHGSYTSPSRDALGAGRLVSSLLSDSLSLYYFWHAVIVFSFALVAYSLFKVWTLGLVPFLDRCDP